MKTTAQIRGVDKHLWQMFILKCKKDLGKEWGHLPTEKDPITSAPAYVITQLIEQYLKDQVCVFPDDKRKKDKIINNSIDTLATKQRDQGYFNDGDIYTAVRDWSLMFGMKPAQRTIQDYQILIKDGYCERIGPRWSNKYGINFQRLQHITANTHEYDHMFG